MGENTENVKTGKAPKAPKPPKTPKKPKAPKAPKQPKAAKAPKAPKPPKAPKAPKAAKTSASSNSKSGLMLFSIRNKIIVCFLVPILFMVVVGVSAYQKAAEGMSEKFTDSTTQTINMAMEYVDMSCSIIESEGMK